MSGDRDDQYGDFPEDFLGKRKPTTGQKVGIGCGAIVVGLVVLGAIGAIVGEPEGGGNSATPSTSATTSPAENGDAAKAAADVVSAPKVASKTADDADDVLLVIRQAFMPVISCSGEIDNLRAVADRVNAGRGTAMDAYSAARTAERDCKKMVAERGDYYKRPFKDNALNGIYERTLPACQEVSSNGVAAAGIAKELLDGEPTLKKGQQFRDLHNAMANKTAECKLGLQGVAERAGVPSEEVGFLEL